MNRLILSTPFALALIILVHFEASVFAQTGYGLSSQAGYGNTYEFSRGQYSGLSPSGALNAPLDLASSAGSSITEAENFLDRSMSFAAWRSFNSPEDGGVGFAIRPNVQIRNPFLYGRRRNAGIERADRLGPWMKYKLGPFYMDSIRVGAGMLYSDYQGRPFGIVPSQTGDDNFAAITWVSMRLTAFVTDRFALTLQPTVYWLPLEGDVGWGIGSPFMAFGANFVPSSLVQMAYRASLGDTWDFSVTEQFLATFLSNNLLDESFFLQANLFDMTPIDRVGRYRFGGGGVSQFDAVGRTDFAINDQLFSGDRLFFQNYLGANLFGRHGGGVRSALFYNRWDSWNNNFEGRRHWNTIGGLIIKEGPVISPYAFSQFRTMDDFNSWVGHAVVGANAKLSPSMIAYAQAGWLWADRGRRGTYDSWLALAGFKQALGPYTEHGLEGGRSPTDNLGTQFISDYVRYFIRQALGPNLTGGLFFQKSDLQYLGGAGQSDRELLTAGALLVANLSADTRLSFLTSYNDVDMSDIGRGWKLWTYRISLLHHFTETLQGSVLYQYQDAGAGLTVADDFTEHLLYVGMSKRF